MLHKAWSNKEDERCPIVFQGHATDFKITRDKKITDFDSNLAFPDCNSIFELTDGYEMMRRA